MKKKTYYLATSCLLLNLWGCVSTSVNPMNGHRISPLPENTAVKVFSKEEPTFRYEKICEISFEATGSQKTALSDWDRQVATEARKCGATYAITERVSGWTNSGGGGKQFVTAFGIKKLSEGNSIDQELSNKISQATQLNNADALKTLLQSVPSEHAKRSAQDQLALSWALLHGSPDRMSKKECSQAAIDVLVNQYDARLIVDTQSTLKDSIGPAFRCPGIIEKSFHTFSDRNTLMTEFNNFAVGFINNGANDENIRSRVTRLMPLFEDEVARACEKSATDDVCLFKPRLIEIKNALNK